MNLPSLVFGVSTLERYPAQRVFGRFWIGDTPVQPGLIELFTPRGVLDTHPLHRAAAHAHAVTLAEPRCELLQVEVRAGIGVCRGKGALPWPR